MMCIPFYLMQTASNIFSHMKTNQLFGMLSQHLKNFKLYGKKSVPYKSITCIRMLLTMHFRSWVSIIPSLMRKKFKFLLLVSFVQVLCNIILLTSYLVLHPYYKLAYIEMAWRGAKEEKKEHEAGCNRPRVSRSSNDQCALVSSGTGHYDSLFVLPSIVPCMISFGAAMCSLTHLSPPYHCPVSCSLYCIGMMCGGPCSAPDYQTPTQFGHRPLVQSSMYWYIGSVLTALNGQVESLVSNPSCSFLLKEGLAKVLARWKPLLYPLSIDQGLALLGRASSKASLSTDASKQW